MEEQQDFFDALTETPEEEQRERAWCTECEMIRKKYGQEKCPKHRGDNLQKALRAVEFYVDEFYVEKDEK